MLTISTATARELEPAAHVLAEAFIDDPVMHGVLPGPHNRRNRLASLFLAILQSGPHRTGVIDVARIDDDERIVGVAAWEGPQSHKGALARQLLQLPLFMRSLGVCGLPRAVLVMARLASHRPNNDHWYLGEIGVSATARGLGVGTALLRTRLDAIDRDHLPAYLESSTPHNRRLYERHGFNQLSPIPGIDGASPVAMLRR